ncbi:hypothetical protein DFJ73DRAFT_759143 [Zopfochytrium polystomum]|nr:hypothetical protein DFJ73DRAFT_759143 [Zopfochytrium polystomum]
MPTAVRSATAATNTSTVTAAMPATASRGAAASSASATAAKAASRPTISAANAAAARSGGREARGPPAAASSAVPAASTRKPQAQQSPPPDSRSKGWSLGSMRKKASAADPPSAARKASSNLRSATSPSPVTKSNAVVTATRSATPSPDTLVDRSTRTTAPSSENTIVKVETSPARSNQEPAVDPLRSATEDELSILDAVERAFAASKVDAEREAATQVRLRRLTLEREFERELKRAAATGPKTLPPPPAPRNSSMHVTAKSYTLPRPSPSSSASSPVSPASPLPPVPEIRTGARAPVSKRSSSLASTNPVKTATMEQDSYEAQATSIDSVQGHGSIWKILGSSLSAKVNIKGFSAIFGSTSWTL